MIVIVLVLFLRHSVENHSNGINFIHFRNLKIPFLSPCVNANVYEKKGIQISQIFRGLLISLLGAHLLFVRVNCFAFVPKKSL